jgi:hypothetical protein
MNGVGGEGMAKQEAVLPMSCYLVPQLTTRSMLYPQPVSLAGYSNARRRREGRCSFTFPRNFQPVNGINLCSVTIGVDTRQNSTTGVAYRRI